MTLFLPGGSSFFSFLRINFYHNGFKPNMADSVGVVVIIFIWLTIKGLKLNMNIKQTNFGLWSAGHLLNTLLIPFGHSIGVLAPLNRFTSSNFASLGDDAPRWKPLIIANQQYLINGSLIAILFVDESL